MATTIGSGVGGTEPNIPGVADVVADTAGVATKETYDLISSDKVEGTPVRRPNGDSVGQIERLMIDKRSGMVAYAVMSFGGFLGIGADFYPIPWSKLSYNEHLDAYQLDIADDQLRNAPHYTNDESFDWNDRRQSREIYDYYGITPYWGL